MLYGGDVPFASPRVNKYAGSSVKYFHDCESIINTLTTHYTHILVSFFFFGCALLFIFLGLSFVLHLKNLLHSYCKVKRQFCERDHNIIVSPRLLLHNCWSINHCPAMSLLQLVKYSVKYGTKS